MDETAGTDETAMPNQALRVPKGMHHLEVGLIAVAPEVARHPAPNVLLVAVAVAEST
jgi:hypothetical protein